MVEDEDGLAWETLGGVFERTGEEVSRLLIVAHRTPQCAACAADGDEGVAVYDLVLVFWLADNLSKELLAVGALVVVVTPYQRDADAWTHEGGVSEELHHLDVLLLEAGVRQVAYDKDMSHLGLIGLDVAEHTRDLNLPALAVGGTDMDV